MRIIAVGLLMTIEMTALSGCSSMKIMDITSDIPSPLVQEYSAPKGTPYADQGMTWIPLIFLHMGEIQKTADGFHARNGVGIGPLFFISSYTKSDFDKEGRLLRRTSEEGYLLGGLLVDTEEEWRRDSPGKPGHGWDFLYGLFGYHQKITGEKTIKLLWIPIVVGHASA